MLNIPKLIRDVDAFCEEFGIIPATVANAALDDTYGLVRLIRAGEKNDAKARKIRAYMAERRRAARRKVDLSQEKVPQGKQSVSRTAHDDQRGD